MAESFPYPISLSVGKNKANYYKAFADAVAADDQKELTDLEKRTAEAEKNIKKLLKLTDIEMKIGDPTSISIDKNEANNKNSAVASKIFDADPIKVKEFTDLEIKIAEAKERLIALGKSLEEQNSRFGRLQYPAYLSNTSLTRSLTLSNVSEILADIEIKIKESEKNTEKVLIELNKSRNERNGRSNASLTRSHTLAMVTATSLGMVTAFGFAGLVAGILVGLLPNKRR